jgi:hypothetical protein
MPEHIGIRSCRARLLRSDVDRLDGTRRAGGSDMRSLCSAWSEGVGEDAAGLGVDDADTDSGGELPRKSDDEAGDDFREL